MTHTNENIMEISAIRSIQGWENFLADGEAYMKTAVGAHRAGNKVFTPEILYNIIAMGIEKFVMAALMRHGTLPYNHTMADLVEAMDETFPGAMSEIREGLLELDKYQDICDPYEFTITPPALEAIPAMIDLATKMQLLVSNEINGVN